MKRGLKWAGFWVGVVTFLLSPPSTARAGLVNGDFATGDFTGWTFFTDPNGVLFGGGAPRVDLFDTVGTGTASLSADFNVGRQGFPVDNRAGGGIFQDVTLAGGETILSVDIAVQAPGSNSDGGLFELLFDGVVVASHDFGAVGVGTVSRATLTATIDDVIAGTHEFRIHIGRNPGSGGEFSTPNQYLANATVSSVPEPSSLTLCGLGAFALVLAIRGKRQGGDPAR
jgi:hypothetical protein